MNRVEKAAQALLDANMVRDVPVQVEVLAARQGAQVVFQPLEGDVSGMLLRTDSRIVIGVNSSHGTRRQRFTIAHELGHLLLHKGRQLFVDKSVRVDRRDQISSQGTDREEIDANQFASALLMPPDLVRAMWQELSSRGSFDEEQSINALAERFDVSSQAMSYRLLNLGLIVGT